MRVLQVVLAWVIGVAIVGCASRESQLVGNWRAVPEKEPFTSSSFDEVLRSMELRPLTRNLRMEFTRDGKFKVSGGAGRGNGSYKWEGDDLVLTFNQTVPQFPVRFEMEFYELVEKTDFETEVKVRLKKSDK